MKYLTKPVTDKMLDQLMKGRAIELSDNGRRVCFQEDFSGTLSGLYKRGLVDTEMIMFEGKRLMRVFLTDRGISFLNKQLEKKSDS